MTRDAGNPYIVFDNNINELLALYIRKYELVSQQIKKLYSLHAEAIDSRTIMGEFMEKHFPVHLEVYSDAIDYISIFINASAEELKEGISSDRLIAEGRLSLIGVSGAISNEQFFSKHHISMRRFKLEYGKLLHINPNKSIVKKSFNRKEREFFKLYQKTRDILDDMLDYLNGAVSELRCVFSSEGDFSRRDSEALSLRRLFKILDFKAIESNYKVIEELKSRVTIARKHPVLFYYNDMYIIYKGLCKLNKLKKGNNS